MEPTQKPSEEHIEFDLLCAGVDEFEPLPAVTAAELERADQDQDDTSLDDQILAGLVSPV